MGYQKVVFCKSCVISNQRPSSSVEFKHKTVDKKSTIEFDTNMPHVNIRRKKAI